MSRIHKYRALAKDGTWRYGEYPHYFCLGTNNTRYPLDIFWSYFLTYFRRETLGLYTDLKDKNLVEIYDGDLVKDYSDNGAVKRVGSAIGCWYAFGDHSDTMLGYVWFDNALEVIGNIYENPELIPA